MNKKADRIRVSKYRSTKLLLTAGAVFFAALFAFLTVSDKKSVLSDTKNTLSYVKQIIMLYENGLANDEAKSLIYLMDKAYELSNDIKAMGSDEIEQKLLDQYAYNQRVDAVIILDENMNIVNESSGDEEIRAAMRELADGSGMDDIPENPKKSFMTRTEYKNRIYDVSAVPRLDSPGVVFLCSKKDPEKLNSESLSLPSMFAGYNFKNDGILVIYDENSVVATNVERFLGRSVDSITHGGTVKFQNEKDGLDRISFDRSVYYGGRESAADLEVYVLFPAERVFSNRRYVMSCGVLIYILLWAIFLLQRNHSEQKYLKKIDKQFRTISAISSIFSTTFIVNLVDNSMEVVKAPESLKERLKPLSGADTKLDLMSNVYISEEYRSGHEQFTDIHTAAERLRGRKLLSTVYKDVYGEWYDIIMIPQRYDDNGNVSAVLFAARNCSDEKRREIEYQNKLKKAVEDAERANNAKTNFLRRMSHDIRTPINGIRGMLEISEYYAGDAEKQAECRRKIWDASGFLLSLVNDVLDMGKLESGMVTLKHKPFKLHEIIDEAVTLTEAQANEIRIEYTVDYSRDKAEHDRLIGSPLHLLRILQNIYSNAIKYNRTGGKVTVSCRELSSDGKTAVFRFRCTDTGIGMSREFLKRAFEPFTQETNGARTIYNGTGLGLSIVKELTELMGGEIRLESELGKGTDFIVDIPFEIDLTPEEKEEKDSDDVDIRGTRALLAEDNELNIEVAEFILKNEGIEVVRACNGRDAVEKFRESKPGEFDIIFMDIMMPELDGIEAAREIRALPRPDAKTVPICAMTANAFSDDIEQSLNAGMNEHLIKPLDKKKVVDVIKKYRHKT